MQSFLIISKNKKLREEYLSALFKEYKIGKFDVYTLISEKAIGIEEVRILQKQLFLKPMQSPTKAVIIENADTMTIQAQNAMLKSLEEPPNHTIIILTLENEELLLPTIQTRCKIIKLQEDISKVEKEDLSSYLAILDSLRSIPIGERLLLAQKFGENKEKTLIFLEGMIKTLREKCIKNPIASDFISLIKTFQETYTVISTTNVSPRLALENLLLNI